MKKSRKTFVRVCTGVLMSADVCKNFRTGRLTVGLGQNWYTIARMTPLKARRLAAALLEKADEVERMKR